MIISTVSFKHRLYRLVGWFLTFFIFAMAGVAVYAKTPPEALRQHLSTIPVVHDGKCNFRHQKGVECLIFFDQATETVWLVLYDEHLRATHIISVKDKVETFRWVRQDLTV